jgi:hypothetical protein
MGPEECPLLTLKQIGTHLSRERGDGARGMSPFDAKANWDTPQQGARRWGAEECLLLTLKQHNYRRALWIKYY